MWCKITSLAKLPVYALFVAVFFPKNQAIVTASLYLVGIVAAILVALFLNKTTFKNEVEPFILELPEYKVPTISALLKNTWNKSKGFLVKVVTIMFAMSVVIWAFSSFNFNGFTENINDSFLAYIGKVIAPIFRPLGFSDWRTSVALLTGLGAKEVVVNTLSILYGNLNEVLPTVFTGVTAYAFLVFTALYTPCIAALATMRKEYGKEYGNKMMFTSLFYQFALAWVAGVIVNIVGSAFAAASSPIEIAITAVIVAITAVILIRIFTKPGSSCSSCVIVNIVGSAFAAASSPIEIAITAVIVAITAVILIRIFTKPGSSCSSCSGGGENGGCANRSACGNLKACSMKNENLLDEMNKRK